MGIKFVQRVCKGRKVAFDIRTTLLVLIPVPLTSQATSFSSTNNYRLLRLSCQLRKRHPQPQMRQINLQTGSAGTGYIAWKYESAEYLTLEIIQVFWNIMYLLFPESPLWGSHHGIEAPHLSLNNNRQARTIYNQDMFNKQRWRDIGFGDKWCEAQSIQSSAGLQPKPLQIESIGTVLHFIVTVMISQLLFKLHRSRISQSYHKRFPIH